MSESAQSDLVSQRLPVLPNIVEESESNDGDDQSRQLEEGKAGAGVVKAQGEVTKHQRYVSSDAPQLAKFAGVAKVTEAAVKFRHNALKKHKRRLYTLSSAKEGQLKKRQQHFVKKKPRGKLFTDVYHSLLKASWPAFIAESLAVWFLTSLVFSALYVIAGPHISQPGVATGIATDGSFVYNSPEPDFFDVACFSLQVLTVGPSVWQPVTRYGGVLTVIEGFVGIFGIALLTGLVFVKFSKPTARMIFSHTCVVCDSKEGERILSFRVANMRDSKIVNAKAALHVYLNEIKADGSKGRTFKELELTRTLNPEFTLTWSINHVIKPGSPLYGLSEEDFIDRDVIILALVSGVEYTFSTTIIGSTTFYARDVLFQHRHVDIYKAGEGKEEGQTVVNLHDFHDTEPMALYRTRTGKTN